MNISDILLARNRSSSRQSSGAQRRERIVFEQLFDWSQNAMHS